MADPTAEIVRAVYLTRHARHHADCNCCLYRRTIDGVKADGYCTVDEWRWNQAVSRLLDSITALAATGHARHRMKENT
jgi:hypothetical protein